MALHDFFSRIKSNLTAKRYVGLVASDKANPLKWGRSDYLSAAESCVFIDKAISKRAESVGDIEFTIKDRNGNATAYPLLDLLSKPNPFFTGRQFWNLYQNYYDVIGEVYIYIEKKPKLFESDEILALHMLNPVVTRPITDATGIIGFETQNGGKTRKYDRSEIIYVRRPDPKSPLRGKSLLRSGLLTLQSAEQIDTYHASVLQNGGKVEGVFKFEGRLTADQVTELKNGYKAEYSQAKRAGLPLFLGSGAEYIRTGLTPDELSYLEAKKMTLDDISVMTGVPKAMLSVTSDVKFDNADAMRTVYLADTVRPLLKVLVTALDEFLLPDDLLLDFIDPTPENLDMALKEIESGIKNSYMTINEARSRRGLDPVKDGDTILIPFSVVPLSTASQPEASAKSKSHHPLHDSEVRKAYGKVQDRKIENRASRYEKAVKSYLSDQEERIIAYFGGTKAIGKRKSIDEAFNMELEVSLGKGSLIPMLRDFLIASGVDSATLVGGTFVASDVIESWLDAKSDKYLRSINDTTFESLKELFAESLANQDDRETLIRNIRDLYGDAKKTRARMIARTEVHNVTQYGTIEGYKQGGMTTKIWVTVMDSNTRDSHAALDGEERQIDVPFTNGLMFPGDPDGTPGETINCRCVV